MLDFSKLRLTQPSLAGAGAELGKNTLNLAFLQKQNSVEIQIFEIRISKYFQIIRNIYRLLPSSAPDPAKLG
jgi:hypothetical protein